MYKIGLSIPDDAKEKLEVICKKEQRNKNNMMAFLIDFYYQRIQKREKERKSNDEDYDLYEEALKLKGKIHSML